MEEATWDSERISVREGDRLYVPTDGITEAFNPSGEMFGRQRLAGLVAQEREHCLMEAVAEIGRAVLAHRGGAPPSDDVTLLAVEFRHAPL
jgi:sigma-B regulation protein RsbU (phosphoserine phosphatase)